MRGAIKMGGHIVWITFILTVQFSAVWGRNSFYEYYYSRYHHKGHSTTEALSSSTTGISADISDISSEEKTASSVSGDLSLGNLLHSSTVNLDTTVHKETTLLGYGSGFNNDYDDDLRFAFALRVGIIVTCLVLVLIGSCCIFCCIRTCRRRNAVRAGFIISNNTRGTTIEVGAQQQAVGHQYQQPVTALQYPPQYQEERQQLFPPQYQLPPGQQQYPPAQPQHQYSPMLQQGHNPPEAPPPYEFPEKF